MSAKEILYGALAPVTGGASLVPLALEQKKKAKKAGEESGAERVRSEAASALKASAASRQEAVNRAAILTEQNRKIRESLLTPSQTQGKTLLGG